MRVCLLGADWQAVVFEQQPPSLTFVVLTLVVEQAALSLAQVLASPAWTATAKAINATERISFFIAFF